MSPFVSPTVLATAISIAAATIALTTLAAWGLERLLNRRRPG